MLLNKRIADYYYEEIVLDILDGIESIRSKGSVSFCGFCENKSVYYSTVEWPLANKKYYRFNCIHHMPPFIEGTRWTV